MRARYLKFAQEYLRSWDATKAAEAAGYSPRSSYNQGWRLMKNDEVREYINSKVMSEDETLVRLTEQARGTYGQYILKDGTIDLESMVEDGKAYLIKRIEKHTWKKGDSSGESFKVEFVDGQNALIHMGKYHKLFTDKHELDIGDKLAAKLNNFHRSLNKIYGNSAEDPNREVSESSS